MNKRQLGTRKEQLAEKLLGLHGYSILERNYRCRYGEIDLIAKKGEYLVFIEVKFRRNEKWGSPLEAVDSAKQRKIKQVAKHYLFEKKIALDKPCRYDVVAIEGDRYKIIENAFM